MIGSRLEEILGGRIRVATLAFLLSSICGASDRPDWQWTVAPVCGELQVKGAKVRNRPFTFYQAREDAIGCCDGLPVSSKGRTDDSGHFSAAGLEAGHYFAVFDLKSEQVTVPLDVRKAAAGSAGKCGPQQMRISRKQRTDKIKVENLLTVD